MNVETILSSGIGLLYVVLFFVTGVDVWLWSGTFFVGLALGRVTYK